MEKAAKTLNSTLAVLTTIVLLMALLHIIVNALSRHFFESPIDATNELVAYWYMPILALVGFLVAHEQGEHIKVSLILDRLQEPSRRMFLVFARCLGIVLFVALAWFGLEEAIKNFSVGMTAGVTSIIIWPVSFVVPVVFVLMAILFVLDIARTVGSDEEIQEEALVESTGASPIPEQDPALVEAKESNHGN